MRKTPPVKPPVVELLPAPKTPAPNILVLKTRAPKTPAPALAKRVPRPAPVQALTVPKAAPVKALAPKAMPPKAVPPKETKTTKNAKTIPVRAVSSAPVPVRVVAETPATYFAGTGGRAWRMSGKHAVAYVGNAALAGELLATEPRYLAKSAMAVYYDRKGKPFAWQLRFDTARWEEVVGRLT